MPKLQGFYFQTNHVGASVFSSTPTSTRPDYLEFRCLVAKCVLLNVAYITASRRWKENVDQSSSRGGNHANLLLDHCLYTQNTYSHTRLHRI